MFAYTSTWPDLVFWRVLLTSLADWKPFAMLLPLSLKPLVHTASATGQRFHKEVAGSSANVPDSFSIKCGMHWWGNQRSLYDRVLSCCSSIPESLAFPFNPTQTLNYTQPGVPSLLQLCKVGGKLTNTQSPSWTLKLLTTRSLRTHRSCFLNLGQISHISISAAGKSFVLFQFRPR